MLLEFIKENENWKDILQEDPFNLRFDEVGDLTLIKYNQICSNFGSNLVQESRGCIINNKTLEYVCRPFDKFFNIEEPNAVIIDWDSARVQEKLDGSIIKLFYYNEEWIFSTNGMIDSSKCEIGEWGISFLDLIKKAINYSDIKFDKLNQNNTYMFEITSPYNKVVVPYVDTKLYHIGTRNNLTGDYYDEEIGIEKPKEFKCSDVNEIKEMVNKMTHEQEGFVVVDKYWNRVKIKSPQYVLAHRLVSNGMNIRRAYEIIKMNEQDEFLAYYPEYKEMFNGIESSYSKLVEDIKLAIRRTNYAVDKKTFANNIKDEEFKDFLFKIYDGKFIKWYLDSLYDDKVLKLLEDR